MGAFAKQRRRVTLSRSRIFEVQKSIKMEGHGMLLSRYVSMLSTRQGIFGALFSALLALDLFSVATAQEVKQIKLTDKYIQGFIAAQEEMTKLYEGANLDDPKVEAQAE